MRRAGPAPLGDPRRLAIVLALGAMMVGPGGGAAQQPSATASGALVGSWPLVSVEEREPGGKTVHWMGPKPRGLLVYDRAGNVPVQIMRDPAAPRAPADPPDGYVAYFGRYEAREREGVVVHRVLHGGTIVVHRVAMTIMMRSRSAPCVNGRDVGPVPT